MVSLESLLNPLTSQESLRTQSYHHSTFLFATALTNDYINYCYATMWTHCCWWLCSRRTQLPTMQQLTSKSSYQEGPLLYYSFVKRVGTPTVLCYMMLSNVTWRALTADWPMSAARHVVSPSNHYVTLRSSSSSSSVTSRSLNYWLFSRLQIDNNNCTML